MSLSKPLPGAVPRSLERGLSVIELMIGVAIGLFVVAGGAKLLADGLVGNRRVVVESRISQDLRAATDVIARDLRRASYWERSLDGVSGATLITNPYGAVSAAPGGGNVTSIDYRYSRDGDNAVNTATEVLGFQRQTVGSVGRIMMEIGANQWQPLTDINTVNVLTFNISPVTAEIRLGDMCRDSPLGPSATPPPACCRPHPGDINLCKPDFFERMVGSYAPVAGVDRQGKLIHPACPELVVRSFIIEITAQGLPPNDNIQRTMRERVRVRNDQVTHVDCP